MAGVSDTDKYVSSVAQFFPLSSHCRVKSMFNPTVLVCQLIFFMNTTFIPILNNTQNNTKIQKQNRKIWREKNENQEQKRNLNKKCPVCNGFFIVQYIFFFSNKNYNIQQRTATTTITFMSPFNLIQFNTTGRSSLKAFHFICVLIDSFEKHCVISQISEISKTEQNE